MDLIKKITVKDFEHFTDHLNFVNSKTEPIVNKNLFLLKGEEWRDMRSTLSPTFTSSKMRSMFSLITETAENFAQFHLQQDEMVVAEMKRLYLRYVTDTIASCAFGVKCDSLKDTENEFYKMGQAVTLVRGLVILRNFLAVLFPAILHFFRVRTIPKKITDFFECLVKDSIQIREEQSIIRPDMIHMLIEARRGRLQVDNINSTALEGFATVEESTFGKSRSKLQITDDLITAQAVLFFFAGLDTTSTTLSFISHELAVNPDIQRKLQSEIDAIFDNSHNGRVSYEDIIKLKYLDQIVSETLRKYPPGYILNRVCVKDYTIPPKYDFETPVVLEKGCAISIPVYGLHMDPKYFPNPEIFDPDRFSDENKAKIVPGSYMPFGMGPRNCIASRFALMNTKALLFHLLAKFDIVPVEKTNKVLQLSKTVNLGAKGGIWLGLKKREFIK